ncbi:N-acetylmuramoyl-L-alanine amidase [Streptomyces sp. NPDC000880]
MAAPLSADRILAALRAEGLKVVEYRSWRTNNRNHKGAWGPVHGVMIHHTVTSGTASSVELCYNGHSALPGPLCHGVIDKAGTVHLVGNGRANHAGLGDGDVLRAVVDEKALPADNEADTDGNRYFYGFEAVNLGNGKDPWPAAQLLAIEQAAAALCRAHGWTYRSVIGHLEWQPGKIDPRGFTMDSMRERIKARLTPTAPKPPAPKPPAATPAPAKPKVSLAHIVSAAKHDPAAAQGHTSYKGEVLTVEKALKAEGLLTQQYVDGSFGTKTIAAYAAWQKRLGYKGADADGIPGKTSLAALGKKRGFTVTA